MARWTEGDVALVQARNGARRLRVPHAHRGRSWEEQLAEVHDLYRQAGRAIFVKVPTPVHRIGRYRQGERGFAAVWAPPVSADFVGTLKGGRSAVMEAKSTHVKTTWSLGEVQPHQARHLLATAILGGVAGVVLLYVLHGEAFWLPARPTGAAAAAIPPGWCERVGDLVRDAGGAPGKLPSVRIDQLRAAQLGIPMVGGPQGLPDWLSVAAAAATAERGAV